MVQLIALNDVIVSPNRQRREFDQKKLVELAKSIESKGLMHAVVLRRTGDDFELIAGERRLRAMFILFENNRPFMHNGEAVLPGHVPYVLVDQELPLDMRVEAELEENILRVDLTTMERALAIKQLHDLRTEQKGAYDRSASQFLGEQVGHSVADTAREVHGDKVGASGEQDIRDALLIAKHAHDPEVASARTQAEAVKIIRKTAEAKQRIAKAQAFDPSKTPHRLLIGNTYDLWKQPDLAGFADVIITDSWPTNYQNPQWSLSSDQLEALGQPKLIATPPFHIGQELAFDPLQYKGFMGYLQKMDLLPVQKAILSYLLAQ